MAEVNSSDFEGLTKGDVAWIFDECHASMRTSLNVTGILPHLCQEHLLTDEDQHALCLQTLTNHEKIDKIKLLLKNKGARGLQAFLKSLNETKDGTSHNELARCIENAIMKRKASYDSKMYIKQGRARGSAPSENEFDSEQSESSEHLIQSFQTSKELPPSIASGTLQSLPVSYSKRPLRHAMYPEQTSAPIVSSHQSVVQSQNKMKRSPRYNKYTRNVRRVDWVQSPRKHGTVAESHSEPVLLSESYDTSFSSLSNKAGISLQIQFGIPLPIQESIPVPPSSSPELFNESNPVLVVGDRESQLGPLNPSESYPRTSPHDFPYSSQDPTASLVPTLLTNRNNEETPLVEESKPQTTRVDKGTTVPNQEPPDTSQNYQESTCTKGTADTQKQGTKECLSTLLVQETVESTNLSVTIEDIVNPRSEPLVEKPIQQSGSKSTSNHLKTWKGHHTFYVSREKCYRTICKPDPNYYFREKTIIPIGRTKTLFFFSKEVGPTLLLDLYPCGLGSDVEDQFSTLRVTVDLKSGGTKCQELADTCWCDLKVKVTTSDLPRGTVLCIATNQKRLEQGLYSMQFDVSRIVSHNSVTHEASCENLHVDVFAQLTCRKYIVKESKIPEEGYVSVDIERPSITDLEEVESISEEPVSPSDIPSPFKTHFPIQTQSRRSETISVPVEVEDREPISDFPDPAGCQSPSLPPFSDSGPSRSAVEQNSAQAPPPFVIPPLQETVVVAENAGAGKSKHEALVLPQPPQPPEPFSDQLNNDIMKESQKKLESKSPRRSFPTQESNYFSQESDDEHSQGSSSPEEQFIPCVSATPHYTPHVEREKEYKQGSAPPVVRPKTLHLEPQDDEFKDPETQFSIEVAEGEREKAAKWSMLPTNTKVPSKGQFKPHYSFKDFLTLRSPRLSKVSKYYQCAESIAHVPLLGPVTVFACGYHGCQFHSVEHDITVTIPKGAIPEGLIVHFELAVSLQGPFKFHDNTRPISPILWLCPQEEFEFQKPFKVILPHTLLNFSKEDEDCCTIKKATEYDSKQGHNLFDFEADSDVCVEKPRFFSKGVKQFVEFEAQHCCHYCLAKREWKREQLLDCGYHLHIIKSKREVIYSVTYYLGSCKLALMEQYPKERGYVLQESKLIRPKNQADGSGERFEITLSGEFHNLGVKMSPPDGVINASDVDYWGKDYKLLEHDHKNHQYPPRVRLKLKEFALQISLQGCTRDEDLTTDVIPYVNLSKDQHGTEWPNPTFANSWTQPGHLTEKEHLQIHQYLHTMDENDIILLGQALGLLRSNLKKMKNVASDMIDAWLIQADCVLTKSGCPTWESLCNALKEISQGGIARLIEQREISAEMAVFQPLHVATSDTEASHFINHVHTDTYRPLSTRSPRDKTRTESTDSNTPSSIGDTGAHKKSDGDKNHKPCDSDESGSDTVASTPGSHDASHSNCQLS